jgi:hypothetical protein
MKTILAGYGEVGRAVCEVFGDIHDIAVHDPAYGLEIRRGKYDILLVAIPYNSNFVDVVTEYTERYQVEATIIFSTVAIGTTRRIPNAVHSPVEGKHPRLAESIRLMPRWVGGYHEVTAQFFREAGFVPRYCAEPEFTEFLKLRSTSKYGVNIEWTRYEKSVCDNLGMEFDLVREFDRDYNALYLALGYPEYQRYILYPPEGPINGHCIRPNAEILDAQYPSVFLKEIYAKWGDVF